MGDDGGGNGWTCGITDGGRHRSLVWHERAGKGRGGEAMRGEGESDGLKKKGRPIGLHWAIFSSWAGVQSNEGNECIRK
jgi:hypothetical protein